MRDYYPKLNRRSNRHSMGQIYYPPEFRQLSRLPNGARNPGSFPCVEPRESASEPDSPIHLMKVLVFAAVLLGSSLALAYWIVS